MLPAAVPGTITPNAKACGAPRWRARSSWGAPLRRALPVVVAAPFIALASACPDPPPPCDASVALAGAPDVLPLPEGGRAFLAPTQVAGIDVALAGLAPGFSVRVDDDGTFVIGAPYGVVGNVPVRLEAACRDAGHDAASQPLTLEVRAPRVYTAGDESGPAARSLAAAAVVGDTLLVSGGTAGGAPVDDVWTLDLEGGRWQRLDVAAPPSPARAAPIDDRHALFLSGDGRTFVLDTSAPSLVALSDDDVRPASVGHGAFAFAGGAFVSVCGDDAAASCGVVSVSVDVAGARATWTTELPTGFAPARRSGAAWGVDDEGARMVLFGGDRDDGAGHDSWSLDDTGVGSGSVTFAHLATKGEAPPGRVDACGVVDPVGRRFFVFGGTGDDGEVVAQPWVLDLNRDDAKWRPVTLAGLPARAGCTAVYDAARARILVGFGDDGSREHGDVTAIDL